MRDSVGTVIAQALQLERPLAVLDIESSGTAVETDRIVELAMLKIHPGGALTQGVMRFNPGVPIPPEVTEVHGITDADVASCPPFAAKAAAIARALAGCDLAGHNLRAFDVRMLAAEFARAGVPFSLEGIRIVDTKAIFFRQEPRDLNAAVRRYVSLEAAEKHAEVAHGALADVEATAEVLAGQLERCADLPRDLDELHAYCLNRRPDAVDEEGKLCWRNGEATVAFGKNAGRSLRELADRDSGYLRWILGGDFSAEVKGIVARALAGDFPAREVAA